MFFRTAPTSLVPTLRLWRDSFQGSMLCLPGRVRLATNEGAAAVEEAIDFLTSQQPLPAIKRISRGMSAGAQDHVNDIGPKGLNGHTGSDGSSPYDRISRSGKWRGSAAENIAYGATEAEEIVAGWIVDDGVASRGHRTNIFKREMSVVGIASGPHRGFDHVVVVAFAADYAEGGARPSLVSAAPPAAAPPASQGAITGFRGVAKHRPQGPPVSSAPTASALAPPASQGAITGFRGVAKHKPPPGGKSHVSRSSITSGNVTTTTITTTLIDAAGNKTVHTETIVEHGP